MPNLQEIRKHMESVRETQKITNAMYMISSNKMNRARQQHDRTAPFFQAIRDEIQRLAETDAHLKSRYFDTDTRSGQTRRQAFLVITADKGLAGDYNHNILRKTQELLQTAPGAKLYVVGEYGRQYFRIRHVAVVQNFHYTAQNPTLECAREIAAILLDGYDRHEFDEISLIYTDLKNEMMYRVCVSRLLPFLRADFKKTESKEAEKTGNDFLYHPSPAAVLDGILPGFAAGFIYSALVDSFCCEQTARMQAMDNAGRNAKELLDSLHLEYNRRRQQAVTQQITEIVSGAKYRKTARRKGENNAQ